MQFIIDRNRLHKELQFVQGVIEKKNTIPVLSNVLIESKKANLVITGTDLDVTIRTEFEADAISVQGTMCVQARKLFEMVKLAPNAPMSFKKEDNEWVTVKCDRARYKLIGVERSAFPETPVSKAILKPIVIDSKLLQSFIQHCSFAITNEESRYTLQGAKFVMNSKGCVMVATDGHRLALVSYPALKEGELDVMIPQKTLAEVVKLAAAHEGEMSLAADDNHIYFYLGARQLTSRMIYGQFPQWERVLPQSLEHSLEFNARELGMAVKRAALMTDADGSPVRMHFGNGQLTVSAHSSELGEGEDALQAEAFTGNDAVDIGMNAHYLQDFFNLSGDQQILFEFNDGNSQVLFRQPETKDFEYKYVVMPMRL